MFNPVIFGCVLCLFIWQHLLTLDFSLILLANSWLCFDCFTGVDFRLCNGSSCIWIIKYSRRSPPRRETSSVHLSPAEVWPEVDYWELMFNSYIMFPPPSRSWPVSVNLAPAELQKQIWVIDSSQLTQKSMSSCLIVPYMKSVMDPQANALVS